MEPQDEVFPQLITFNSQKYEKHQELGRGEFGMIWCYQTANPKSKPGRIAVKCDIGETRHIIRQSYYLSEMMKAGVVNFPKYYGETYHQGKAFMIMQIIDYSLDEYIEKFKELPNRLNKIDIFEQMLRAMQRMHDANFIHQQVKPSHFRISEDNQVYIIDFSSTLEFAPNGKHKKRAKLGFLGCPQFASCGQLDGYTFSRKDDLESLGYVMMSLIDKEGIPWKDLQGYENIKKAKLEFIKIKEIPSQFLGIRRFIRSVHQLSYEEDPDYTALMYDIMQLRKPLLLKKTEQAVNLLNERHEHQITREAYKMVKDEQIETLGYLRQEPKSHEKGAAAAEIQLSPLTQDIPDNAIAFEIQESEMTHILNSFIRKYLKKKSKIILLLEKERQQRLYEDANEILDNLLASYIQHYGYPIAISQVVDVINQSGLEISALLQRKTELEEACAQLESEFEHKRMTLNQLLDEILQYDEIQQQQIEEGYQNIESHEDGSSEQNQEELLDQNDQVELEDQLIDEEEMKEKEESELSQANFLDDEKSGQNIRENLRDLEQMNEQLQIEIVLLKKQLENQRVIFESKHGDLHNLNFVVTGLQTQRDNLIVDIASHTQQNDEIVAQLTKCKENLFELLQRQSEIQSQNEELSQTLTSLRKKQSIAKRESEKLQAQINQCNYELIELQGVQRIKSDHLRDTQEQIKLLENQFLSQKRKVEIDLKEMDLTKENMEREVDALKRKLQDYQNENNVLEQKNIGIQDRIQAQKYELLVRLECAEKDHIQQINNLKSQQTEEELRLSCIISDLNDQKIKVEVEYLNQNEKLKMILQEQKLLIDSVRQFQSCIIEKQSEKEQISNQIQSLKNQKNESIQLHEKKKIEAEEQLNEMTNKIELQKNILNDLNKQIQDGHKRKSNIICKIVQLNEEYKEKKKCSNDKIDDLQRLIFKQSAELASQENKISEQNAILVRISSEIQQKKQKELEKDQIILQRNEELSKLENGFKQTINDLTQKVESLKDEYHLKQQQLRVTLDSIDVNQLLYKDTQSKVSEESQLMEGYLILISEQRQEIESTKQELSQLRQEKEQCLNSQKDTLEKLVNDIMVARINLNTQKQQRIDLESENKKEQEELMLQLQVFQQSINSLKDTERELKSQCAHKENQIQNLNESVKEKEEILDKLH
ncbi:hypothetical protein FGO68_gene12693 [Halteria grandinella]|uniref:Casein kinase I n=1 Tax=Halteria grandinella TaxID=5974 RepID=A0A8J8P587_HALGN|nr:hypothetical protein FGO68_gene12693 [Halteria grandinella]